MYPISVYSDSSTGFARVAVIDDYEFLSWERRWREPDSFMLRINRHKKFAGLLSVGGFIGLWRGGEMRGGRIEYMQLGMGEGGKGSEVLEVRGVGVEGLLARRLALRNTAVAMGSGYDVQSGVPAETAMRHYVNVNAVTAVNHLNERILIRDIPHLRLAPDQGRGVAVTMRARFQPVSEVLFNLSLISGLGWGVSLQTNPADPLRLVFEFTVKSGRNLLPTQDDNPPVTFSPEFGNISALRFRHSLMDSHNVAYVAGQGEAAGRILAAVNDTPAPSHFGRREIFVDARDLDDVGLLPQRGRERLAEWGEEQALEFEFMRGGAFEYQRDFELGDIVRVTYPGVATMDGRIVSVSEEVTPDGERNVIVMGQEWTDFFTLLRATLRDINIETRR